MEVPYELSFLDSADVPSSVLLSDSIADLIFVLDVVLHFLKSFEDSTGSITRAREDPAVGRQPCRADGVYNAHMPLLEHDSIFRFR